FRFNALTLLSTPELAPSGWANVLEVCEAADGYCDFDVASKVDDYMGTKKRTARDVAIDSPIAALQAKYLSKFADEEMRERVDARVASYRDHLAKNPLDIPAFTIRDLEFNFGTGRSPLEVVAASAIIQ